MWGVWTKTWAGFGWTSKVIPEPARQHQWCQHSISDKSFLVIPFPYSNAYGNNRCSFVSKISFSWWSQKWKLNYSRIMFLPLIFFLSLPTILFIPSYYWGWKNIFIRNVILQDRNASAGTEKKNLLKYLFVITSKWKFYSKWKILLHALLDTLILCIFVDHCVPFRI